jgi:hypothetical protein
MTALDGPVGRIYLAPLHDSPGLLRQPCVAPPPPLISSVDECDGRLFRMESRVELFALIRRRARVEGLSVRALAVRQGVHRRTVRQVLVSSEPPERKPRRGVSRKLESFEPAIDAMLVKDTTGVKFVPVLVLYVPPASWGGRHLIVMMRTVEARVAYLGPSGGCLVTWHSLLTSCCRELCTDSGGYYFAAFVVDADA